MQNINPSRNITRRGRFYLFVGGLAFFGGAISLTLGILFNFFPLWETATFDLLRILMIVAGILALAAGIGLVVRALTLQKDNSLAFAVGEALKQFLDERFTYMRNVSKRRVGYIDAVLIGPPGALIFRVVDYPGVWKNERAEWLVQTSDGRLRSARSNPSREAVRDVVALRKFFAKFGLESVPIYAIVIFTSRNVRLSADGPVVPIAEIPTMYQVMRREFLAEERIDAPTAQAAVEAVMEG